MVAQELKLECSWKEVRRPPYIVGEAGPEVFAPVAANDNTPRRGDWMQTFSGRQFWPLDPRPEDICIEDIAHALAMQCRFAGHCLRFYSVAEHSVLVAHHAEPVDALWALMHDAAEAYVTDVIRPIKPDLAGYKAIEARVMRAVCERYGLPLDMPAAVKEIDDRILADERDQNMATPPADWRVGEPLGVTLQFWSPEQAEREFLDMFAHLTEGRAVG